MLTLCFSSLVLLSANFVDQEVEVQVEVNLESTKPEDSQAVSIFIGMPVRTTYILFSA